MKTWLTTLLRKLDIIDEEEAITSWQEKLAMLEGIHYYDDIYFWDTNYFLLDSFTESELKTVRP